jgi:hypothetical protein
MVTASISEKLKAVCGCGAHHSTPAWMWLLVGVAVVVAAFAAYFVRRLVRAHGFGTRGHRRASQRANIAVIVIVGVLCAAIGWKLVLVAALGVAAVLGRAATLGAREHEERPTTRAGGWGGVGER